MTTSGDGAGAEMLPGLRAAVADAQAKAAATRARNAQSWEPAAERPVASVLLDLPLAHLDRPFDYAVPASMADAAVPGARVKVRFAGQEVPGFVVGRGEQSAHDGRLQPLKRVVSPEPVLSPEIAALSGLVAQHWAGVRADVLRLAVPPRHATTERVASTPAPALLALPAPARWGHVRHHDAFFRHLGEGSAPHAVWGAVPGDDWPAMVAEAVGVALAAGRGAVVCVPDGRDVDRVSAALTDLLGEGQHAVLRADVGPAQRYAEFLSVSRGARRVVVGTRSAAFAPVRDVGLFVIFDDGDPSHHEPRAPYPHTREVLRLRAEQTGAGLLVGGFARSIEADQWVASGFAAPLDVPREEVRRRVRVDVVPAEDRAIATRLPRVARDAIRTALDDGRPVLVQTPRQGYAPALACEQCRTPARCTHCAGPMQLTGPTTPPACRWCATAAPAWACPTCGHHGLRAPVRGNVRT
ncbi:MAG: primosome assembly protein PriA, partial [Nocardioides sp.]|uniref:primosomal protein N' family DNA-binding protein n=1 Tax=Nocardioides sp. TaxID=35761 RepID=UPI003F090113